MHPAQRVEYLQIVKALEEKFHLREKTKVSVPSPYHDGGDPETIEWESTARMGHESFDLVSAEIFRPVPTRGVTQQAAAEIPAINVGLKLLVTVPEEIRKLGDTGACTGRPRFAEEFETWSLALLDYFGQEAKAAVPTAPELFGHVQVLPGHREALFFIIM
jgi:hypothetical protein